MFDNVKVKLVALKMSFYVTWEKVIFQSYFPASKKWRAK